MNRPAFTLVELMIATFLTCVIAAGVFMFFSGSGRLSRDAYETVSAVMSNRVVREKAIFRERENAIFTSGHLRESPYLPYDTSRRWEDER